MTKTIKNVFISSKYRQNTNETSYDFTAYFPSGNIRCNDNEELRVNILNFHCPNTMYNINDNNNQLVVILKNKLTNDIEDEYIFTLTNGNYNVYELRDHINTLCTQYIELEYNKIRNTYTFNDNLISSSQDVYILAPFGKYLGLEDNTEYKLDTPKESVKPVNLVAFNKIIMNCDELQYSGGSLENIDEVGFEISSIFFWASRQDVANMAEIVYDNADGGNSFSYSLQNKFVDNLRFVITNEDYQPITDLPDWTMVLQFTVEEQSNNDVVLVLSSIQEYLKGLYAMMFMFLQYLKIV